MGNCFFYKNTKNIKTVDNVYNKVRSYFQEYYALFDTMLNITQEHPELCIECCHTDEDEYYFKACGEDWALTWAQRIWRLLNIRVYCSPLNEQVNKYKQAERKWVESCDTYADFCDYIREQGLEQPFYIIALSDDKKAVTQTDIPAILSDCSYDAQVLKGTLPLLKRAFEAASAGTCNSCERRAFEVKYAYKLNVPEQQSFLYLDCEICREYQKNILDGKLTKDNTVRFLLGDFILYMTDEMTKRVLPDLSQRLIKGSSKTYRFTDSELLGTT